MPLDTYFDGFDRRDWEVEEPDGTVRIAVVGVGEFARERALPAMAETTYCTPTALISGSPDTASVADAFGIENVIGYDAYLDGAAADSYDAVYVATPNATHVKYGIAAARRGTHVLCEKPLAADRDAAARLVDVADDAGVALMTAYRLRLEPAVRRARELVRDGVIGDVVQIHAGFSHPLLRYADGSNWRLDPALSGGGALVDLGVHALNTIRFLLDVEPITVSATTHSVHEAFAQVDEHVAFQLEFPGPTVAACTASFNAHASSALRLTGSDGLVSITAPFGGVVPQEVSVESGEIAMEHRGRPIDEVREEFAYFGYCVLTDTAPEPDGWDGLADLAVIESIYEAAARGERVPIEVPTPDRPPGP